MTFDYRGVGLLGFPQPKRKVFVSFHHANDRGFRDAFANAYSETYEIFIDRSVPEAYDSEDAEYVRWQIRRNDIKGSSCTIVLCGAETHLRKHVDWEIKSTLDFMHGLLAIILPTCTTDIYGRWRVPDRLADNVNNGFGRWLHWSELSPHKLKAMIEEASGCPIEKILNDQEMRKRNG